MDCFIYLSVDFFGLFLSGKPAKKKDLSEDSTCWSDQTPLWWAPLPNVCFCYVLGSFFPLYTGYFCQINTAVWVESSGARFSPKDLENKRERMKEMRRCAVWKQTWFSIHIVKRVEITQHALWGQGVKQQYMKRSAAGRNCNLGYLKTFTLQLMLAYWETESHVCSRHHTNSHVLSTPLVLHMYSLGKSVHLHIYDIIQSADQATAAWCVKSNSLN